MYKLNYSSELRKILETFLEERKIKCTMEVFYAVCYTSIFISILKDYALISCWFIYFWIIIECIAFFRLFSVDHILRPRFEDRIMLTWGSEIKLLLRWSMKKGLQEFEKTRFLISEAIKDTSESMED